MPLVSALQAWAALPYSERLNQERKELQEAQAGVGKIILFEHLIHDKPLPPDFSSRYPDAAVLLERVTAAGTTRATLGKVKGKSSTGETTAVTLGPDPGGSCSDCGITMSTTKMKKQDTSYYCGPASLQALVWNDPKAPQYNSQSYWAGKLGTTSSNGTWVYALRADINGFTHWDDWDYASTYEVVGISSWSTDSYRWLFRNHIKGLRAPVQLHPKLIAGQTSSYYPGTTSGHYNVARGFEYDGSLDKVYLYEPAGGPANGNIYTAVYATEDTDLIKAAQYANSNQRNIIY